MKLKITKHKKDCEYYSVEFPKGVSLSAIGKILGRSKQAVSLWQKRVPKKMLEVLKNLPEGAVKK